MNQNKNFNLKTNNFFYYIVKQLYFFVIPKGNKEIPLRILFSLFFLILATFLNVTIPFIYGYTVDQINKEDPELFYLLILLIGSYALAKFGKILFDEVKDFIFVRVTQKAVRGAALFAFEHLHNLSLNFHLNRQTGGLSRAIDRGAKGIELLLRYLTFEIFPVIGEAIIVTIVLWSTFGFYYSVITLLTVIFYSYFTLKVTEWRIAIRKKMNEADEYAATRMLDSLLNFETVKYFNSEKYEIERYNTALKNYEDMAVRTRLSLTFVNLGQGAIISLGLFLIMGMSAYDISKGNMSIGDFVIVNTFLLQLYVPLEYLGFIYREIRQSIFDMNKMFNLLEEKSEISEINNINFTVKKGKIEFQNMGFNFGKRNILNNINLIINPNEKIAIVGPTGSGKSTLSKLLFRFYDPSHGNIYIDDKNIRKVSQDSLRSCIGVVPQDTVMFNETIKYNITYGSKNVDDKDLYRVSELAQISGFISKLHKGFDTRVGERGLKLSGGEKQRIAIARVMLKKIKVLVLDEATSALDLKTEKNVLNSIDKQFKYATKIIIAHRLSTIKNADKIFVLNNGKIIENGKHKQLIENKNLYKEMWDKQNN